MIRNATIIGRLTKDPELRFSQAGKAIASFSVVTESRKKNPQTQEYEDYGVSFWNCSAFGPVAENVCESFVKGSDIIVVGDIQQDDWTDKDGNKRSGVKVTANEIGYGIRWTKVQAAQNERSEQAYASAAPPF